MAHVFPSVSDFRIRYPEFADLDDPRVQYWMDDALRIVTDSWLEADYPVAIMAYAAHRLALQGAGSGSGGGGVALPGGVSSFRSASMAVSVSERSAYAFASGAWSATPHGSEFEMLMRRNVGGPVVVQGGHGCGLVGGAPWLR